MCRQVEAHKLLVVSKWPKLAARATNLKRDMEDLFMPFIKSGYRYLTRTEAYLSALLMVVASAALSNMSHAGAMYKYDDGSSEESIGQFFLPDVNGQPVPQPETIWLNAFQAASGGETTLTSIDIAYGKNAPDLLAEPENGSPVKIYIWSDPTNDGDPSDAVVVAGPIDSTVQSRDTDTFINVTLPVGVTFNPGEWFFAGFQSTVFAVGIDTSSPLGRSWVAARWSDPILAEPDNLSGARLFGPLEEFAGAGGEGNGNFLIRVFADGPLPDTDMDGVTDDIDDFPADPVESSDTDGDGIGDNTDTFPDASIEGLPDSDGDGAPDTCDEACQASGLEEDPFVNAVTQKNVDDVVVNAEPEDAGSSAQLMNVEKMPFDPPEGFTGITAQVGFEVDGLSTESLETIQVQIDFGEPLPSGASVYKVGVGGALTLVPGAIVAGTTISYSITDNDSLLDADPVQGSILDPVVVGMMEDIQSVPTLPYWLLGMLSGLLLLLGRGYLRKVSEL